MEDAIAMIQKLVFDFQTVIPNDHLIIDLLELVLRNSLMSFDKEYFQQIFGIIGNTWTWKFSKGFIFTSMENLTLNFIRKKKTNFLICGIKVVIQSIQSRCWGT